MRYDLHGRRYSTCVDKDFGTTRSRYPDNKGKTWSDRYRIALLPGSSRISPPGMTVDTPGRDYGDPDLW